MKREKQQKRDPRINVHDVGIKDYLLVFFVVICMNSAYLMIFMEVFQIEMTAENLAAPELISFLAFSAVLLWIYLAVLRRSFHRPMQRISEAARKVAQGDFSARLQPMRRDGRKDAVEVMFEDFNTMAEELSSIEALKEEFIANVSHEIKTPLAVIQSYASAIQQDDLPDAERRVYAKTIVSASQNLSALVTNILKLNKLENQEIRPQAEPFHLGEQLRRCALAFESLWEQKALTFSADIEDVLVCYDESMLELIWNNLISNAIKFTEPGGSIAIEQSSAGERVIVRIIDSGCGIDAETKEHIFDKFYQADTSHAEKGNGLGLALVMKAAQIIGAEISVDSIPGKGTAFSVCLRTAA